MAGEGGGVEQPENGDSNEEEMGAPGTAVQNSSVEDCIAFYAKHQATRRLQSEQKRRCEHNRKRSRCKVRLPHRMLWGRVCVCVSARTRVAHNDVGRLQECEGSQICSHNRRKSTCKVGAPPLQLLPLLACLLCVSTDAGPATGVRRKPGLPT